MVPPLLNIYYFFIRRGLLWGCIKNVFQTFSSKFGIRKSPPLMFKDRRLVVELFIVCYLGGLCWVPGGHIQFMLWYMELIPLLFGMSGLPIFLYFKLYKDVFPVNLENPNVHHVTVLAITGWLMTVGPSQ